MAGKPTVCHTDDAIYVLGLQPQHGWRRGSRIVISQEDGLLGAHKVAVAWVVEQTDRAAKINVIFQRENHSVEGGTAALHEFGDRLLFEHYYARMAGRNGKSITLDIGENDGVQEGHSYEARSIRAPDYPVGLVRVTRVHDMQSDAVIVEEPETFGAELHEFVFRRPAKPPAIGVAVATVQREAGGPEMRIRTRPRDPHRIASAPFGRAARLSGRRSDAPGRRGGVGGKLGFSRAPLDERVER